MPDMAPNVKSPFVTMGVLRETLSHLASGHSNDRVSREIVLGQTVENLHSDDTLFELLGVASESLFDDKPKKPGVTFAVFEARARNDTFQLYSHLVRVHTFLRLVENSQTGHIRHRTTRFLNPGSIRPIAYDRKS
jgi:hypothetical protein